MNTGQAEALSRILDQMATKADLKELERNLTWRFIVLTGFFATPCRAAGRARGVRAQYSAPMPLRGLLQAWHGLQVSSHLDGLNRIANPI